MNESNWWPLFLKGDKQAFSEIFIAFHDDLFRYGIKLTHDPEIVKDCIQNLFLKLWKNRENLRPVSDIKPYLFRSLRNHIIDILELKRTSLPMDPDVEDLCIMEFTAEDFIISGQNDKETCDKVIQLLKRLNPRQRHAVYLRFFENLDFDIIARIMDMQVQSVRNSISRGLHVMRKDF